MLEPLDKQAWATILAALRFYDQRGQGEPNNRTDEVHEIATAEKFGDEVISLDSAAIRRLEKKVRRRAGWAAK